MKKRFSDGIEVCQVNDEGADASLNYSEKEGFYVRRYLYQAKIGNSWETIPMDDSSNHEDAGRPIRVLETFRPISRDQAIRLQIENIEDHGGIVSLIHQALDAYGLEGLKK